MLVFQSWVRYNGRISQVPWLRPGLKGNRVKIPSGRAAVTGEPPSIHVTQHAGEDGRQAPIREPEDLPADSHQPFAVKERCT